MKTTVALALALATVLLTVPGPVLARTVVTTVPGYCTVLYRRNGPRGRATFAAHSNNCI